MLVTKKVTSMEHLLLIKTLRYVFVENELLKHEIHLFDIRDIPLADITVES